MSKARERYVQRGTCIACAVGFLLLFVFCLTDGQTQQADPLAAPLALALALVSAAGVYVG